MSGEFGGEQHRRLVFAVRFLFERSLGFRVYETCYDGPGTAMVPVGDKNIRFDVLMKHETPDGGVHYFCECKFRSSVQAKAELKSEFKSFVKRVLETLQYATRKYGENHFCFLFIATIPFDVWEENIHDVEYLRQFLGNSNREVTNLVTLSNHLEIIVIPRWLIMALTRHVEV